MSLPTSAAAATLPPYFLSSDFLPKDEAEAVRLYRLAAAQGNANGQDWLGVLLATGRGMAKDEAEAFRAHLVDCAACQAELRDIMMLAAVTQPLATPPAKAEPAPSQSLPPIIPLASLASVRMTQGPHRFAEIPPLRSGRHKKQRTQGALCPARRGRAGRLRWRVDCNNADFPVWSARRTVDHLAAAPRRRSSRPASPTPSPARRTNTPT